MSNRDQLVKFAFATGLVKEAVNPMAAVETVAKGYGAAAKGLGADIKSGAGQFFENVLGKNVAGAKAARTEAKAAIGKLDTELTEAAKAGKPVEARFGEFAPLRDNLEAAKTGVGEAEMATRKARLAAGAGAGAIGAGLLGLKMYRNAAAKAMNRKLLMGAGAAGLGGLALGSALD
jgi:hypothetical protein